MDWNKELYGNSNKIAGLILAQNIKCSVLINSVFYEYQIKHKRNCPPLIYAIFGEKSPT